MLVIFGLQSGNRFAKPFPAVSQMHCTLRYTLPAIGDGHKYIHSVTCRHRRGSQCSKSSKQEKKRGKKKLHFNLFQVGLLGRVAAWIQRGDEILVKIVAAFGPLEGVEVSACHTCLVGNR